MKFAGSESLPRVEHFACDGFPSGMEPTYGGFPFQREYFACGRYIAFRREHFACGRYISFRREHFACGSCEEGKHS